MRKIDFNAEKHAYTVDGKSVISVTQLLRKYGFSPEYAGVSSEVLSKAAEKGTLIHEEIADYVNKGEIGFTQELQDFIRLCAENGIEPKYAEIVAGNDIVAGTIDLTEKVGNPNEIKTTSVLHKNSVRWQLSLYAYLMADGDKNYYEAQKIGVFHLVNGGKYHYLELIPIEEVERLLDCERKGEIYTERKLIVADKDLQELLSVEEIVYALKIQAEETEKRAQKLRQVFYDKMTEQGLDKYEIEGLVRINCVKPSTRESIDGTRLKKELPDIAREYTKISPVKGSLRITLLGDYNGTEN